jgi:hypothetical protein
VREPFVYCCACCESLVPPGANMCFDGADMALMEMGVIVARWDGLANDLSRFIGQITWRVIFKSMVPTTQMILYFLNKSVTKNGRCVDD